MRRRVPSWAVVVVGFFIALYLLWPAPPGVVVEGAVIGSLTALAAIGVGLVFRSQAVVNFAQADLGAVPAAVFAVLMTVKLWSYWMSMAAALVVAAILGLLIERVVVRWFSKAPRLVLTIATLGLAQMLAGAGSLVPSFRRFAAPRDINVAGISSRPLYAPPLRLRFWIGPISFDGNDVMAGLVVALVAGCLFVFLRYTDTGLALRGSAESPERAQLLGIPVPRLHGLVWMVAAVLSAFALILRAGLVGLPGQSLFGAPFLLRTLTAAVLGRMQNLVVIFAAALGIGILDASMFWHWRSTLLVNPMLCVIIVCALLVQHRQSDAARRRDSASSWRQGPALRPVPAELASVPFVRWGARAGVILLGLALAVVPLALGDAHTSAATAALATAVVGLSLMVLTGWAGELSLGQMAFAGVGAAFGGVANIRYRLDPAATVLLAGALGAAAAVLVGLAASRVRGIFLAMLTLAVAVGTSSYVLSPFYFATIYRLPIFVQRVRFLRVIPIESDWAFYYFCLAVLGIVTWWARGLQRSRTARVLVAARENPRAVQAFGVNLARTRLTAYAISGFLACMAGSLLVIELRAFDAAFFAPLESVRALSSVVVGGVTSLGGVVLGTVFMSATRWAGGLVPREYGSLVSSMGSGAGLLFVLMLLPGGLATLLYRARDALLRGVANRSGVASPALMADPLTPRNRELVGAGDRVLLLASRGARSAARALGPLLPRDVSDAQAEAVLRLRSVGVAYGPVQVLFGIDLEVRAGEVVALLGTNGAGKSTVLRAVSGLVDVRGDVRLDGAEIGLLAPHRIAALGVVHAPSGVGTFGSLTVAEHLRLASWLHRVDGEFVRERTGRVLDLFPELNRMLRDRADGLSGGQQLMVKLAMAFMAKPRLLMLDEPSVGLGPAVLSRVVELVARLRDDGVAVLLVEQSASVALGIADRAYFLEKGEVRFHGGAQELLGRRDILRAVFLGRAGSHDAGRPAAPSLTGSRPVVLETRELTKTFAGATAVDRLSVVLHEGEILGIVGPNGAGKTTLFEMISGFEVPDSGCVRLDGVDITRLRPDLRSRLGLARSFQDGQLFGALTVHQAIAVALDRRLSSRSPLADALHLPSAARSELQAQQEADELVELLGVGSFRDKLVLELSTGTRRIVDLACQLATRPRVMLLDEPSAGIAQREAEALAPLLLRLREKSASSLLVIEHDMALVAAIADRVVALHLGRSVAEGDAVDVLADARVVESYLGTRVTSGPVPPRSRRELYDLARQRGVRGRSRMTKRELERAVAEE
jgi:ABC-type branched-subunit amino acid transport system ATPase component/ABC-type branched-subunit amino acid transport system permease subunit